MFMYSGIDVSYWQQGINWLKVKAQGIAFAYVKATEGISRKEPEALSQANGAKGAGLMVGYYHFSHIDTDAPETEAIFFASVLSTLPKADLMPVLDIETNKSHMDAPQVNIWIKAFMQKMAELGYPKLMIYSYTPFLNVNLPVNHGLANPLWIAQYRSDSNLPNLPIGWTHYQLWQYSNQGTVDGIPGKVDMNKCDTLPLA